MLDSIDMAGQAGQGSVSRVGKRVRAGGIRLMASRLEERGEVHQLDIPLSPHRRFQPIIVPGGITQRTSSVEG